MSPLDDLSPIERRRILHRRLDELLDLLPKYKPEAPLPDRAGMARLLLMSAADFAAFAVGEEIVRTAYTRCDEDPDPLPTLAHRLVTASALFPRFDSINDPASLTNAAAEIRALAAGDVPQLLAQRDPSKKIDYRLARQRLRALEWYEFLCARQLPRQEAKDYIADAYGFTWDAISRWKKTTKPILGGEHIDTSLWRARLSAERSEFEALFLLDREWKAALLEDGAAFQAELARSKPGEFGNVAPEKR